MPAYGLFSGALGGEVEEGDPGVGPKCHRQGFEVPSFCPPLVYHLRLHLHQCPPPPILPWEPSLTLPPPPPPPISLLSDPDSKEDCFNAWDCSCLIQSGKGRPQEGKNSMLFQSPPTRIEACIQRIHVISRQHLSSDFNALIDSKCSKDCDANVTSATPIFGSGTNLPHETDLSSHKESLNGFTQKISPPKEREEELENKASSSNTSNTSNTSRDSSKRERRDDVFLRKKLLVNSIHCLSQVLLTESLEDDDAYRLQISISSLSSCLLNLFGHTSHGKSDLGELDQVSVRDDPEGSDEVRGHDDEIHAPELGPVSGSLDKNDGITNKKSFSNTMPDHLSLLQNHLFVLRDDLKMLRAWFVDMQQDFSLTMLQIATLLSKPKVSAEPSIATVSHTNASYMEGSNEMEQNTSAVFTVDDGDHVNILFSANEGVYTKHLAVESLKGDEILQEEPIIETYFDNARGIFQDSVRMLENPLSHSNIDSHSLMEDQIQNAQTTKHESEASLLAPKEPDSRMPGIE